MVRSSAYESHYSTGRLRDGSPVVVVRIQTTADTGVISQPSELPPAQEPMVIVYPHPTASQSWRVIQKGCAMLLQCVRLASGRYLRRCNMAYEHLAGIRFNRQRNK